MFSEVRDLFSDILGVLECLLREIGNSDSWHSGDVRVFRRVWRLIYDILPGVLQCLMKSATVAAGILGAFECFAKSGV